MIDKGMPVVPGDIANVYRDKAEYERLFRRQWAGGGGACPLRVTRIAPEAGSPLQVLVTNEGVSSSLFTLSCRANSLDQ